MRPAQDLVEAALSDPGEGCVVIVEDVHEAEVRFANNSTTTNGVRTDRRVTVVRMVPIPGGTAAGACSRRGADVDLAAMADAAVSDARSAPPAADAQPLLAGGVGPGYGDPPGGTDLSALGGAISELSGAFARAGAAGRNLSGFAEHRMATTYLGTSAGIRRRHLQPTGSLHLVGRREGASAWAGSPLESPFGHLEEQVARGLSWASRRVELPAGRYEVLLPPAAVADLMVAVAEAAGGRETEEGRTVFSAPGGGTRLGERLTPLAFDLWSDPDAAGLECSPFLAASSSSADVSVFDNGLDVGRVGWIGGGTLQRLRYHRAGAARAGAAVTPPVDNLLLDLPGATATLDAMVAETGRGLLLTCLWYIREVDPATLLLTGLTRDGVYLVEDGRVVGAVNNFRFNESPVDLLARASEAGAAERTLGREFGEWLNRTRMPPLRVPDFNMSSVSQAS